MPRPEHIRMTLGEHFEELRRCLLRALIGVAVALVVCLVFGDRIMQIMCWPAAAVMRYRGMPVRLRMLAPTESFGTYMKVCLVWGLILSAPYGLWQLWRFVAVGLYPAERRLVGRYVPLSGALFVLGVVFFLAVIAPICLNFFIGFAQDNFPAPPWASPVLRGAQGPPGPPAGPTATAPARLPVLAEDPADACPGDMWIRAADGQVRLRTGREVVALEQAGQSFLGPELTLANYMTFVSWLSLMFGLSFQVPIAVLVLTGTGILPLGRLRQSRKYVILGIVIVAAVLTPPDVISQIALAIPMYLLFELGLLLAGRTGREHRQSPREGRTG